MIDSSLAISNSTPNTEHPDFHKTISIRNLDDILTNYLSHNIKQPSYIGISLFVTQPYILRGTQRKNLTLSLVRSRLAMAITRVAEKRM
jgi:hypothetical protein